MRPTTKHYLFFAFLLASLALLVALVLWQWHRARADEAETGPVERGCAPSSRPVKPAGPHALADSSITPLAPPARTV